MMADLVCDHICLGKVAAGSKLCLKLPEKCGVEIELLIARAIERPGCGAGITARRVYLRRKQDQLWRCVPNMGLLRKHLAPGVLGHL